MSEGVRYALDYGGGQIEPVASRWIAEGMIEACARRGELPPVLVFKFESSWQPVLGEAA